MSVKTWLHSHAPAIHRERPPAPTLNGDPFSALQAEIDRLFDDFGRGTLFTQQRAPSFLSPQIDMVEHDGMIEVTAELPGVDQNQIDVTIDGETLVLRGEKTESEVRDEENIHFVERTYGAFRRDIPLGFQADPATISATAKKGVLTITLAKPASHESEISRIPISVGD